MFVFQLERKEGDSETQCAAKNGVVECLHISHSTGGSCPAEAHARARREREGDQRTDMGRKWKLPFRFLKGLSLLPKVGGLT